MILTRTPLRISLAGGGTDLPEWYLKNGSMFISGAINKYIYITLHKSEFHPVIRARYSIMEEVDHLDKIQNGIIRETFRFYGITNSIEITSHAEIPDKTGLGSSGSFGVGVVHAVAELRGEKPHKKELAGVSTYIQSDILKFPIGQQDQWIAAYGGVNVFEVNKKGKVKTEPLKTNLQELESKLVMFYTGFKRDTNEILSQSSTEGLDRIQELAWQAKEALEKKDFDQYGRLLNEHWQFKKKRGPMTNSQIDEYYEMGLDLGALGGKLVGAGGGGFLLFYTNDRENLIKNMPLQYQDFKWDMEGSKVIYD